MSHSSSVGTGTPQDDNENHPRPDDHWPSRTMGADAAHGQEQPPVVLVGPIISVVPGQPASEGTEPKPGYRDFPRSQVM